jgi:transcriptional regulator with XRE-family HTH domain
MSASSAVLTPAVGGVFGVFSVMVVLVFLVRVSVPFARKRNTSVPHFSSMQQKIEDFSSTNFAVALATAIRDSGLSKRAFGQRVGITHTSINRYLTGGMPALDEATKLARFLGVTLDELVNGKARQPRPDAGVWRERALSAEQRLSAVKSGLSAMLKKI